MEMIEIEAFVAIAESGTFTQAAAILHCSQPAISRRIKVLENELGAPLFERIHSGVQLTEVGKAFLPHAQSVLASVRDSKAAVHEILNSDGGTITLALIGTLASTRLTDQLVKFRAEHPRVRLILHTALSDEVSELVRTGEASLGLRYGSDPHPQVVSYAVYQEELTLACSPQNPLVAKQPLEPRDLDGMSWIIFPINTGSRAEQYARLVARQLALWEVDDAGHVTIDSLTAQKRLIEADFGIGLLPASSIEEELRLGTLATLNVPSLVVTIPVVAIHRRDGYLSGAAKRLLAQIIRN